jgi:hypothetical protein
MGTQPTQPLGYAKPALDLWARRARTWSEGGLAEGLKLASEQKAERLDRDVYLYVISGHKVANPAAAQALIERVAG